MKRILPLFLTLSVAPLAYAADPTPATPATPATVTPDPAPVVDPAANVALEKAAAAYAAATGMSVKFTSARTMGDKTTTTTGSASFVRPDQARVETKAGDGPNLVVVADSAKLFRQVPTTPVSYMEQALKGPQSVAVALNGVNNAVGFPFSTLATGRSLLKSGYTWETVTALPDGSVKLTGHAGKAPDAPQYVMTFAFDAASGFVTKADVSQTYKGKTTVTTTTFTDAKANPEFTPGTFTYVPTDDIKPYVEPPMYDPKLVAGVAPYALTGMDMEGKPNDWAAYKGKVVLLDFWATWCGPCIGELPNVLKNYDTYHGQGFDIVGVSLDSDKQALVDFIKAKDLKYPNFFDGQGWGNVNGKAYGVQAIPFSLLIGKDGKIAAVNPRGEALEPAIKAALAQ